MKNIIRLFLFILFITCFSFGEKISINDISVRFCDENNDVVQKRVSLYSETGKGEKECVLIVNNSTNSGYIDLHFVSQTRTNQWEIACALPGNPDDVFVKYLKPSRSGLIYVWPDSTIRQSFQIEFPVWINGVRWWCMAFLVDDNNSDKPKWNILSLVTRKASLFEILVDDNQDFVDKIKFVKLKESTWRILFFWNSLRSWISLDNENKTVWLNLGAQNLWNVSHSIYFSGKVYWLLWYKNNFVWDRLILRYNNTGWIILSKTWISLPEYQWLFRIKLKIAHALHFDFDTSHIPKDKLIEQQEKYTIVFFVLSRMSIWFWLIIILIVLLIYRVRKKTWWYNPDRLIKFKKIFIRK